jgi:hypothetical protein
LVNLTILTPAEDYSSAAAKALALAESFTVEDAESSIMAQEVRAKLNTRISVLDEARKVLTRPIDVSKQTIMDFFNGPIGILKKAKTILDAKVLAFDNEQERIRKEAQRKAEAAAATERRRLQDEADERQRVADQEAKRLRDEAAALEAAGDTAGAERLANKADKTIEKAVARVEVLQDRAAQVVAPIIQAQTAKASGSSFRDNWKFEVIDASKINDAFMMRVPNEVAIAALVKSMHEGAADLVGAGIRIYNDRGLASKRA